MKHCPLEVCVDTPDGLRTAQQAGADRVELCAALGLGGLTPGAGLIAAAVQSSIPAHMMIRPRAGDFILSDSDLAACLVDISTARRAGLAGVVIGAQTEDGDLSAPHLAQMVEAAGALEVTLHRVIDLVPNLDLAIDTAAQLGIRRILSSGQAPDAGAGAQTLSRMVSRANGRLEIMAGGGVTPDSVPRLLDAGVDAIHASCSRKIDTQHDLSALGLATHTRVTDPGRIADMRAAIRRDLAA